MMPIPPTGFWEAMVALAIVAGVLLVALGAGIVGFIWWLT